MNNCLVTKLNAVVNDDTLPVIETMQQFTLDAIALSGNDGMTEEQKYALNRFFYQIGAITNSSLWQKIDFLFLPLIAGEVSKIAVNYKGLTLISGASIASDVILGNGGVITTNSSARTITIPVDYSSYDPNNISAYVSYSEGIMSIPGTVNNNRLIEISATGAIRVLYMYFGETSGRQRINFSENGDQIMYCLSNYGGSDYLASLSGDDSEHTALINVGNDSGEISHLNSNYTSGRLYDGTMTTGSYSIAAIQQSKGYAISASIVGKALTGTEADILMDAIITLKHNFITSQESMND